LVEVDLPLPLKAAAHRKSVISRPESKLISIHGIFPATVRFDTLRSQREGDAGARSGGKP